MKMLNSIRPRTEPYGTPETVSCHSLNLEPTLTRCFVCHRLFAISARLLGPNP